MGRRSRRAWVHGVVLSLTLWPGGAGCWAGGDRPGSESPEPASGTPWVLFLGQRGGFTGGGSGQSVRSDGTVHSWSQATPDAPRNLKETGHATPEKVQALEQAMTAPDLRDLKHRESGNLTGFLEWRQGRDVREYSWAEGAGTRALPAPLQRAYDAALAAVNSARH